MHAVALLALLLLDGPLMALWRSWDTGPVEWSVKVFITKLGKSHFHVPGLLLLLVAGLITRRRTLSGLALRGMGAVALAGLAANLLKLVFLRVRPSYGWTDPAAWWWSHVHGHSGSFPSADAATTFALAAVLATALGRGAWVLYVIAGLVGFGRFALHCHWPSDIYAGALLGVVTAQWLTYRLELRARRRARAAEASDARPPRE